MISTKYEVKHGDISITVNDNTGVEYAGTLSAMTHNGSVAELTDLGKGIEVEGLNNPVYYFNRIKAQRDHEGKGEGRALMIEVCKVADKNGITIFNELNPYGNRNMERLKSFFRASGFEDWEGSQDAMVRKPKRGKDEQRITRDSETET